MNSPDGPLAPVPLPVPPDVAAEFLAILMPALRDRVRTAGVPLSPRAEAAVIALIHAAEQVPSSTAGTASAEPATVVITARQAAALLACSPGFVRRLARSGRVSGHKAGPVWLIDKASLDAYRYGSPSEEDHESHAGPVRPVPAR